MDRRRFLLFAGGAIPAVAGCQSGGTESPATTEPTATPDEPRIDVDLETSRYLVRAFERGPNHRSIWPDEITPVEEVPEPLREALEAARDGPYETEAVSEAFLAAVDSFRIHGGGYAFQPYVHIDGAPYEFEPTVPEFVASLDFEVDDHDPERTVDQDDLDDLADPAADFVRTIGAYTTMVPRDEYRISLVPEEVETLLEDYDYVRDPSGVGRIETERVDPGPPYTVELQLLTDEDLWGRPVLEAEELPGDLRELLETAAASDRRSPALPPLHSEHRTDELPDSFADRLGPEEGPGSGPYVVVDGTVYSFRAREVQRNLLPAKVSVATAGPRSFEVVVEPSEAGSKPAVEGPVEFESPGALPSVLWVEAGGTRYLLESEVYENVRWEDAEVLDQRIGNPARETIPVDGELSATYRVPESVPAGTYDVWGSFAVSWADADEGRRYPFLEYPFRVALAVGER